MNQDTKNYETRRLAFFEELGILGTPQEKTFDDLAWLAAKLTGFPTAVMTLMGEDTGWFKARVGLEVDRLERKATLCNHVVTSGQPLLVENTLENDLTRDNPFVQDHYKIRSYAGFPIRFGDVPLGTICVIDSKPRSFDPNALRALRIIRDQIEAHFQLIHRRHRDTESA